MLQSYEREQKSLTQEVSENQQTLQNAEQRIVDLRLAVGMIDIPTEKEILATMEEIRNNPQDFKFVA